MGKTFHIKLKNTTREEILALKAVPGAKKQADKWHFPCTSIFEVAKAIRPVNPSVARMLRSSPRFKDVRKIARGTKSNLTRSRASTSNITVPAPAGQKYRPFQLAGVEYCWDKEAFLLGDEMGLGKTIQVLGVINKCGHNNGLIICPASAKYNWKKEADKWLVNTDMKVTVIDNTFVPPKRLSEGLYIINFDILRKFHDLLFVHWDIVVVDEAHFVKNPSAVRSELTYSLIAGGKQRGMLSGTPIVNYPQEIFPLIHALDPKAWPSKTNFYNSFMKAKYNSYTGESEYEPTNLRKLQEILRRTIMIRRRKNDVLTELPPKSRQIIEIPAEGKLKRLLKKEQPYMEQMFALLDKMDLTDEKEFRRIMKSGVSAREAGHIAKIRHDTAVAKMPYVIRFVDEILEQKDKVVTFSHHKDVQQAIWDYYGNACTPGNIGPGGKKAKFKRVEDFKVNPDKRVFDGSIQSDGTAITLVPADTEVFFELDWVPGNISQAEDRVHRMGQKSAAFIYHVVLESSLDWHLAKRLTVKQETIDETLDN